MEEFKFSVNLVNTILQYLGNRPYVEVVKLIQDIQKEVGQQSPKPVVQEESINQGM